MPRLVNPKVVSFFILSLLITFPLVSSAGDTGDIEIINVYSIGDKAAFLVMNTSNNHLMELVYENGRFTRVRPLNFSLEKYSPVHWNGEYWLLQKGLGPVVELYIYNSTLKHVKTFVNGTICAYNDLRIWWDGEEYLLTFLKSSPNDNPATGECYYLTDMYLLPNDKLIPLNVSGTMTWIPPLKEWFATGVGWSEGDKMEKIGLINETDGVMFLNVTLQGLYGSEIAYNGSMVWLVLVWAEGNLTHIEVYWLGRNVARRVYHEDANGSIGIPIATWGNWPQELAWNGNPILIQSTGILNDTVLIFNRTGFLRVGTFSNCSELTPVSVDGRVFILCMEAGGKRRVTIMKLFAIKGSKKELVRTFMTSGYPYRYGVRDFLGFPAFKERNDSSLILYTHDSIVLFNSTHTMDLLTGERTPIPAGLRGRNYNVAYCSGGWLLFTKSEVYTLKDGKFAELKLTISFAGEATNGTTSSPVNTQSGENTIPLSKRALALIITGVVAVLLLLALHGRGR